MSRIAVAGKDGDFVAQLLESNRCVDYEALSSADSQIRMEENDTVSGGVSAANFGACHCAVPMP